MPLASKLLYLACGPFAIATLKLQAWSHQFAEIAMSLPPLSGLSLNGPATASLKPGCFRLEVEDD